MEMLSRFIVREHNRFTSLGKNPVNLLISYSLASLIEPIFNIFINVYLWRQTQDVVLISVYNIASFIGLPLGFYVNGLLLKKFHIRSVYWAGCISEAVIISVLMFLKSTNLESVALIGFLMGLAQAMFWANRNFLTLSVVESQRRLYFSSLETITGIFTNIVVPAGIGWFIVLGSKVNLYTPITAYKILAVIIFIVLFFVGYVIKNIKFKFSEVFLWFAPATDKWKTQRLIALVQGIIFSGNLLLPIFFILRFIGQEPAVGTIYSLTALFSIIVIYSIGRKAKPKNQLQIITTKTLLGITAAILFSTLYSFIGVILFYILTTIADGLNLSYSPLEYDVIEHESSKTKTPTYSYIFDIEVLRNTGRVLGLLFFIFLYGLSAELGLRFTLLMFGGFQIIFYFLARNQINKLYTRLY